MPKMVHTKELSSFTETFKEFLLLLSSTITQLKNSGISDFKNVDFLPLKSYLKDPLVFNASLMFVLSLLCWINSLTTDNFSQVDRLWSILPFVYVFTFAHTEILKVMFRYIPFFPTFYHKFLDATLFPSETILSSRPIDCRLIVMALLVTFWSCRLTYNFHRKGGYRSTYEDYRWVDVRKLFNPFVFQIFNLVFIALIQQILLLYICTPAYLAYLSAQSILNNELHSGGSNIKCTWTVVDTIATIGMSLTLLFEAIADQQQWNFHAKKHSFALKSNSADKEGMQSDSSSSSIVVADGDVKRGFLTHGLFRFCRHPNFFCEISNWYFFFLFSVGALHSLYSPFAASASSQGVSLSHVLKRVLEDGLWFNWTLAGATSLNSLFLGSTWLTEKISSSKYPAYATYQRTTSRLWPWIPGPALRD